MSTKVWSDNYSSSKIDSAVDVLNNGGIILCIETIHIKINLKIALRGFMKLKRDHTICH